jgi:pilus assembly protein CpaE
LEVVESAKSRGIAVILVAEDISPTSLHKIMRAGANEFLPYPLPEGELKQSVEKALAPPVTHAIAADLMSGNKSGKIIAFHGLSGGCGASTIAINLAYELAHPAKGDAPSVCFLDLELQYGSVATFLDLDVKPAVAELLADVDAMDADSFKQALIQFDENLSILSAPSELMPLDILSAENVESVLNTAKSMFDYVFLDVPKTIVPWTEVILEQATEYYAVIEADLRSAQNALRFLNALDAEQLPRKKVTAIVNRAPKFTDLNGRARIKRIGESLGLTLNTFFSDGAKQVTQSAEQGEPLASYAPKNALRKELVKFAAALAAKTDETQKAA